MHDGPAEPPDVMGASASGPRAEIEEAMWLRAIRDMSPVGIYRTDREARCTFVNARWCELTGLSAEEAMGDGWLRAIHPEDRKRVAFEWKSAHRRGVAFKSEYRYQQPDGKVVWILGEVGAVRDGCDRLLGYVGSATDVTELHAMREELMKSRAALEALVGERTQKLFHTAMAVEATDDAVITTGADRKIVSWNKAAEVMFGWTASEMIGGNTERVTPLELRAEAAAIKARVRRGERVDRLETIRQAKSGALIEVCMSAFPLRDARSKIVGTCAVVRDVSGLRKAERRLQRLSRRLLRAQDEERRRLARELHDSTAQTVVALSLNLAQLAGGEKILSAERRRALIEDSQELADIVMRDLRTNAYVLHPPLLDERGLRSALEWFVRGFAVRSGIDVALDIDPAIERLPEEVELALFRVAQESLSNVFRHAHSPTAAIRLWRDDDACVLEIQDRGCGMASVADATDGVGISGMRERIAEFDGTFEIVSHTEGTTVTARIPIHP